jgi:hypothetical protein
VGTLAGNTTGIDNTARGSGALGSNTTGYFNTGIGFAALGGNTNGNENTAVGTGVLENNTFGGSNTAVGVSAMQTNTSGDYNTASGGVSLFANTAGSYNTASGYQALENKITGANNTAVGEDALSRNATRSNNIAIGLSAGFNAPAGNDNSIYIGSAGTGSDNSVTIEIGTEGTQTGGTFIAGISGASVSGGVQVLGNSNGQLGTVLSSRRFKEQITDMGDTSSKLLQLRPVNYFYKSEYDDGSHLRQYGLIAEEVSKVYPEMVAYDNDGQILTAKYQLLAPMLLNEVQKQDLKIRRQAEAIQLQEEQYRRVEDRLAVLETQLSSRGREPE